MLPPGSPHNRAGHRQEPPPDISRTPRRPPPVTGQGPLPHTQRGPNYVSVTIATNSDGRQQTLTDGLSQVRRAKTLAVRATTWLRDEEAT